MISIDRSEVEGFRGISRPSVLPLAGKSLLLFGENGTGKSSFIDALEKLFTGRISTLEGRMGVSGDRHGPNIRSDEPPKIEVRFSEGTEFGLDTEVGQLPNNVKDYLDAAREPLFILRRRELLEVIERRPSELYDLLSPFLPLAEAEEGEAALRETAARAEGHAADTKRVMGAASADLAKVLGLGEYEVPVGETQVCESLSRLLHEVDIGAVTRVSDLGGAISALDNRLERYGDTQRLVSLHRAKNLVAELRSSTADLDFESFRSDIQALRSLEESVGRAFFEEVLQRGLEWIRTDWQGVCPLCETPWEKEPHDKEALVSRIQARLDEMREVVHHRQNVEYTSNEMLEAVRKAKDTSKSLSAGLDALGEVESEEALDHLLRSLSGIQTFLDQRLDQITVDGLEMALSTWDEGLQVANLDELHARIDGAIGGLPSPGELKPLLDLRSLMDRSAKLWEEQSSASSNQMVARSRAKVASLMLDLAEHARKEEIQGILNEVSNDLDELYKRATGGDQGLRNLRLELRPEVRASVMLRSDFYDKEGEVPNAYGSDAQLDILGLCAFLALRRWYRRERPEFNLLIPDDVLTSVDSQHAVRMAELILREFADYQVLITTHDRIWYEHLSDIQARCRVKGQYVNKVIHRWTLEDGPDLREPVEERERLGNLLEDGEPGEIATEAGRLLEHILQEMRYSLRLGVQAKRGELYEIGELWPAFYSASRKRYPGFYATCQQTLHALDIRWPIRNWVGAHFNGWAARVSRDEVLEFGRAVADLFDSVFCKKGRRFIEPSVTPVGQLSCRDAELIYPVPGKEAVPPLGREELVDITMGAFRDAQLTTDLYFEWESAETAQENN